MWRLEGMQVCEHFSFKMHIAAGVPRQFDVWQFCTNGHWKIHTMHFLCADELRLTLQMRKSALGSITSALAGTTSKRVMKACYPNGHHSYIHLDWEMCKRTKKSCKKVKREERNKKIKIKSVKSNRWKAEQRQSRLIVWELGWPAGIWWPGGKRWKRGFQRGKSTTPVQLRYTFSTIEVPPSGGLW